MATETLAQLAAKLGMRVSQRWNATPAKQEAYARKHGAAETSRWSMSDDTDIQIASRVRMLMRDEMDHEAVVCAARDRICALWVEKAALLAALAPEALEAIADEIDGFEHGARAASLRGIAKRQRAALEASTLQSKGG